MKNMMKALLKPFFNLLKMLFPSRSRRVLNRLETTVKEINTLQEKMKTLSSDSLRKKTITLKKKIHEPVNPIQQEIQKLKKSVKEASFKEKRLIYKRVDQLQARSYDLLQKSLNSALPEAFAIMKETARRFANQEEIIVQATDFDRALAKQYKHINILGEKAHWKTSWEAGGQSIRWNMVHYDVQLMGGIVLHQGKIAEMATGEGKTLVSTLPIYLNALGDQGVHVVTVNDYLAKRDTAWMGPLFQFHGLTVDCIDQYAPHSEERKRAYQAQITYGTNNEFGFDFLRDNMVDQQQEQVQTGHNYVLVDEVDSVFIDDARTPLIISGPTPHDNTPIYEDYKRAVQQLYKQQLQYIKELYEKAQTALKKEEKERAGQALFTIYRGLPKYSHFIELLSEKGVRKLLSATEEIYIAENNLRLPEIDEQLYFTIDIKTNAIQLTEKGIAELSKQKEKDFFTLPDLATQIAQIERNKNLNDDEKINQKKEAQQNYALRSTHMHAISQLLKAYSLFQKDVDYVVLNHRVKIVDEKTGRILAGRRYSNGLHQALEAKEGVQIEKPSQTYATITPQNQFRMYKKLSGMTGTAQTEATEFWEVYRLEVVSIPTNKPVIRQDFADRLYKTKEEKYDAIKKEVLRLKKEGRPILVGTKTVEQSEEIRKLLKLNARQVLNAKNHRLESQLIGQAGQPSQVTIATQMAGRGTDIKIPEAAKKAGGLHIIGAERHENRRVDLQLRGRGGRQGDPGSSQFYISLEDDLLAHYQHGFIGRQMDKSFSEPGEVLQDRMLTRSIASVQKQLEHAHFASRKRALEYDDVMDVQRKAIYRKRNQVLSPPETIFCIMDAFYALSEELVQEAKEENDATKLQLLLKEYFFFNYKITQQELSSQATQKIAFTIYQQVKEQYEKRKKEQEVSFFERIKEVEEPLGQLLLRTENDFLPIQVDLLEAKASKGKTALATMERQLILHILDEQWKDHLQQMDNLKSSTEHAVYENKDPLLVYKFEALDLFKALLQNINKKIVQVLLRPVDLEKIEELQKLVEKDKASTDWVYHHQDELGKEKKVPIVAKNSYARNEKVKVRYKEGEEKVAKYKNVEADIKAKKCYIVT